MKEQYIYDTAFSLLEELGYTVYSYKQMNDVVYPFIEMANASTERRATKSGSLKVLELHIDLWALAKKRKQLLEMKDNVMDALISAFQVKEQAIEDRLLQDNTTNDVLLHNVLVIPIYLN